MDYTTLVAAKTTEGSIKNWLNDSAVPATTVLTEAEAWIYERLRAREMLAAATGTISSAADTIAVPSGYRIGLILWITGVNKAKLSRRTIEEVEGAFEYDSSGARVSDKPSLWYAGASTIQFNCTADQAYPYRLIYWGTPTALGAGNTTNFLTSRYPRLLRLACLGIGYEWKKDVGQRDVAKLQEAAIEIELANQNADLEIGHSLEAPLVLP